MSARRRMLPALSGTVAMVCYCVWAYCIVFGYLPIWSTFFLGIAAMSVLSWRAGRNGTIECGIFGLTRGVVVALPAVVLLVSYSGLGRLIRSGRRAFGSEAVAPANPGPAFVERAASIPVVGSGMPYSLLFGDYFDGEITAAEAAFAALLFDPFPLLIAIESTVLFALGCGVGGVLFGWTTPDSG